MRVFSLPVASYVTRMSLSTISSHRIWSSTDAKSESNEKTNQEKPDNLGDQVSVESLKKLEKDLEGAKEQIEALKNEVQYRAADAENARRISRDDIEKSKLYSITSFAKDMLEVADILGKGIESFDALPEEVLKDNKSLHSIYTGVKLSEKVLHRNMSKHGVERMNLSLGTLFDPNFHDALIRVTATEKTPPGTIANILKDGYNIRNRVLRAAQVGVSYSPDEE
ncbi:unnamed protein product [Phytomonas sp. Hart1]|nr:unnamed protein product [Phytomonas sp. Hart1]|eukprot:CCW67986.1 unnamed protein product [Phytomonas sp. isolate Hart1]